MIFFPIFMLVMGLLVLATIRWVRLSVSRTIKAHQDLARSVSDVATRLERIEAKLGEGQGAKP